MRRTRAARRPDSGADPRSRQSAERRQLILMLICAALLRLAYLALHGPWDLLRGGDGPWYILQGWLIAHRSLWPPLATAGPLFPLLLAAVWLLFPAAPQPLDVSLIPGAFLTIVRLLQIALSVVMVWLGYRLARGQGGEHRVGLVVAFGLALGPAFVMEPFYLLTEPLFMALLVLAAWLYMRARQGPSVSRFVATGVAFGLAAITRPVILLLPLVLVPHLLMVSGARSGGKWAVCLLGAFFVCLMPWGAYLYRATGSALPQGFSENLWIGAVGEGTWEGTETTYSLSAGFREQSGGFVREVVKAIVSDPLHWLSLRARNLTAAVVTPHGTSDLPGPSIKLLFSEWLRSGRPLAGLWGIVSARNFALKLVVYAFHAFALVLGAIGAIALLRRWREVYVEYAVIAYMLAINGLLTATPRYLFPAEVFLWVLAGTGFVTLWERLRPARVLPVIGSPAAEQPAGK